jgi:hypothetical protein
MTSYFSKARIINFQPFRSSTLAVFQLLLLLLGIALLVAVVTVVF